MTYKNYVNKIFISRNMKTRNHFSFYVSTSFFSRVMQVKINSGGVNGKKGLRHDCHKQPSASVTGSHFLLL